MGPKVKFLGSRDEEEKYQIGRKFYLLRMIKIVHLRCDSQSVLEPPNVVLAHRELKIMYTIPAQTHTHFLVSWITNHDHWIRTWKVALKIFFHLLRLFGKSKVNVILIRGPLKSTSSSSWLNANLAEYISTPFFYSDFELNFPLQFSRRARIFSLNEICSRNGTFSPSTEERYTLPQFVGTKRSY